MTMNAEATPPRKKDAEKTRLDILNAAAAVFAEKGYAQAGMREIARRAGITPALIVRYYESKENLYALAFDHCVDLSEFVAGSPETFGRDMVSLINRGLDDSRPDTLSMQLLAISDPAAQKITTPIVKAKVLDILVDWLERDVAIVRATLIATVLSGVWLYRDLLPLDVLQPPINATASQWLESALQSLATGEISDQTTPLSIIAR